MNVDHLEKLISQAREVWDFRLLRNGQALDTRLRG